MIIIKEDALVVTIRHTEPRQFREQLFQAFAAAFRWKSTSTAAYTRDDDAQYTLAQLMEEMTESE